MNVDSDLLIQIILNMDDPASFVKKLLYAFSGKSSEYTQLLCDILPDMINRRVKYETDKAIEYSNAAVMSVYLNGMNFKSAKDTYFAGMVPVCKAIFPTLDSVEKSAEAGKQFFRKFIDCLFDKKCFDFDNPDDISWAKTYNYLPYLSWVHETFSDDRIKQEILTK